MAFFGHYSSLESDTGDDKTILKEMKRIQSSLAKQNGITAHYVKIICVENDKVIYSVSKLAKGDKEVLEKKMSYKLKRGV